MGAGPTLEGLTWPLRCNWMCLEGVSGHVRKSSDAPHWWIPLSVGLGIYGYLHIVCNTLRDCYGNDVSDNKLVVTIYLQLTSLWLCCPNITENQKGPVISGSGFKATLIHKYFLLVFIMFSSCFSTKKCSQHGLQQKLIP